MKRLFGTRSLNVENVRKNRSNFVFFRTRKIQRLFLSASFTAAISFFGGCSSDLLKSKPKAPGLGGDPLAAIAEPTSANRPELVEGVGYVEANAYSTPPFGANYYRDSASANAVSSSTVSSTSTPRYPAAPTISGETQLSAALPTAAPTISGETQLSAALPTAAPSGASSPISGVAANAPAVGSTNSILSADYREANRLREELIAARADVKRQVDANESLLRQNATYRRDAEETFAELRRQNAELAEKNRLLLATAAEFQTEREQNERRFQVQTAALRKSPTTIIVPNNSAANAELKLSDPRIFPIRRVGDSKTIELQDDLLFENDANALSDAGKQRLRIVATEILRRYPTNVLAIQGHCDVDPVRPADALSVQAASVQKAYLVAEFLVEETGVARNQTIVGGSGAVSPIVSNENATNRRRNRRVEITIRPETVVPQFDAFESDARSDNATIEPQN